MHSSSRVNTETPEQSAGRNLRVLHLEDSPQDHLLIKEWLLGQYSAAEIVAVDNEADFLASLKSSNYDIILSDHNLPGFGGLEALRLAREKYPHIPFVFVTGSLGEEAAIQTIREGATDFVLKDRLSRLSPAVDRAIHEARQAEKLRQTEEKIREQAALLDTAQDAILVRDLEDRILFWNKSAERLYGWPALEIIGGKAGIVPPKDLANYREAQRYLLETGTWTGELTRLNRAGTELIVESRWTLVRDAQGAPKSVLVIDTDITGKKALEAQFLRAQRLESLGGLASGIAHDLNNCLSPILMGVAVLKDQITDPGLKQILAAMESSATRGAGVVKQLLSFARGSSGEKVVIQPNHLIHEIVKITRETFPRSIQIKAACATDLWTIQSDATQFHQILLNLCVNARDAMPDGGALTIASANVNLEHPVSLAGLKGEPGPYVRIDVKDSGSGIPPEIQQKIFHPFFTTKEEGKGTGLGLSTTVSILARHGGLLGLDSSPGRGTTFSLYFPANASSVAASVRPGTTHPAPAGRHDLILLVDDEAAIREMCKFVLESWGYQALTAENGAQALALFNEHRDRVALVVSDSSMPVMGGSTAIRAMRADVPNLKVISTTGGTVSEEDVAAADPKRQRFLAKPYTVDSLLQLIGELLADGRS
jgi:PAS domain S-box-containing protein